MPIPKNCKLTSLNNPARQCGAGEEKELWRCHICVKTMIQHLYSICGDGQFQKTGHYFKEGLWPQFLGCNLFFFSLLCTVIWGKRPEKHGSGLEVTIMSLFNLLDTKLADRQGLGLLGVYWWFIERLSCENNVWTISLAPVISSKRQTPLYGKSWLYELCVFFLSAISFSFSEPYVI